MNMVSPATPHARGSDYAELSGQVRAAGLLRRRPRYYAAKSAATLVVFAAGWVVFALLGDAWWQLVTAADLAQRDRWPLVGPHRGALNHQIERHLFPSMPRPTSGVCSRRCTTSVPYPESATASAACCPAGAHPGLPV